MPLSSEAIEQVARTKQIVVVLDGGITKTQPVTFSNNKYPQKDQPAAFHQ
jgi:hypothetical protein